MRSWFSFKLELIRVVELHPVGYYTLLFALGLITMIHPHPEEKYKVMRDQTF